ncbi:MAG: DUF4384 domain-containing protein [Acidobacteria bacterium]|nr:DUF4384 domain-containing protein [Acidobacteriota bacterium]
MGLVIYEMLTGRIAVTSSGIAKEALFYKQLEYTPPTPGISREVDRVVMRAISKMPSERQATITDLALEMDSALAKLQSTGSSTRPSRRDLRSKLPLLAGLMLLLLLGSGGAGWFYMNRGKQAPGGPGAEPPAVSVTPVIASGSPVPAMPVAASKLSVLVKTGNRGDSQIVENLNEHVFTSRDEIRFMIDPPGGGYIYLLQRGSRGDFTLLYPDSRNNFSSEHQVKAGTPTFFPKSDGNKPLWFKLDTPGVDTIYVVFATGKTVKLARLIEDERSRNSNKQNRLDQVLFDKGIEALLQQALRQPLDDLSSVARYEIRHVR